MTRDLAMLFPEFIVSGILVVMMFAEILRGKAKANVSIIAPLLGSVLALGGVILYANRTGSAFNGMFLTDPLAVFFKAFFAAAMLAIVPMCGKFFKGRSENPSEFFLILWSSLTALFFLVSSNDLLVVFITLETFTLSLYALAAYMKRSLASIESGIKYLIMGSLASAFMVYGIALIYFASGTTSLPGIKEFFLGHPNNTLMLLGTLFIISGIGFKIAAVPFQMWVPDVYEGAPAPVTAYLAVASKTAGFALLLRLLFSSFQAFDGHRPLLFSILAVMTLLYGNLGALAQTNIKRLFGYSSIGHAGYLLIGAAAGGAFGVQSVLYYLIAYAITNLCAFWVITLVTKHADSNRIDAFRGLAKKSPFLAGAFFLALLSLAGVPPLAGFFGKFLVLLAAVQNGLGWVALVGAVAVAVSLYYYLNVVRTMYFEEPSSADPIELCPSAKAMITVLMALIILAGFYQAPFWNAAKYAATALF